MTTPFFSLIIVLTEKNSYLLPFTLDSIAHEQRCYEVAIVDGTGGKVVLDHLPVEGVKIIRSRQGSLPQMMNLAMKEVSGEYLHFLMPGEFYIWDEALNYMRKMIQGYNFPDLVYTPRRVRHHFGQPVMDLFPLTTKNLKRGEFHWSLQSYFFRRESLLMMGGFSEKYGIKWGYDVICRFFLASTLTKVYVKRLITDYEYRRETSNWIWKESVETAQISFKYFGLSGQLLAWMMQNCLRLFRFLWKMIRLSCWKKYASNYTRLG